MFLTLYMAAIPNTHIHIHTHTRTHTHTHTNTHTFNVIRQCKQKPDKFMKFTGCFGTCTSASYLCNYIITHSWNQL